MAVISPSVPTEGRNTGFSYVFNASRAVFQGNLQNVTQKSYDVGMPKKCNIDGTVEKTKDGIISEDTCVLTAKTPAVGSKAGSACATSNNIGQSNVAALSDRTRSLCSNAVKSVVSKSTLDSGKPQKPSSSKRSTCSTNEEKSAKENVNIVTDVPCSPPAASLNVSNKDTKDSASDDKTFQKQQEHHHSYGTKAQQTLARSTISEQTVKDKTSTRQQINCDKTSKLNEQNEKERLKANTTELLNKSKLDVKSSSGIKGLEEKNKKGNTMEKKSLLKKKLDEKSKQSTNEIQQNDVGQKGAKNANDDSKTPETKIITQSGKHEVNKHPVGDKSSVKSRNEITSKTQSEKSKGDTSKIHTTKEIVIKQKKNVASAIDSQATESSDKIVNKREKDIQDPVNKATEKISLNTKISDVSLRKSVKERAISPNRISVEKRSSGLKSTETSKPASVMSHISQSEISGEKRKSESEINSPKQFTKSPSADRNFANAPVKLTPKEGAAENKKSVCPQKLIAKSITEKSLLVEKHQIGDLKKGKLIPETDAPMPPGEVLVTKSKTCSTKNENGDQTVNTRKGITKRLVDKFPTDKKENLTTEKMSKDDGKTPTAKADVSQGSNAQSYGLRKSETDKTKVENSAKLIVDLQKDLLSRPAEKSRENLLTGNKCDDKGIERIQKNEHSDTCVLTDNVRSKENIKTSKMKSKNVAVKTPKVLSNPTESKSGNETEMRSSSVCLENPQLRSVQDNKSFSKDPTAKHPSEKPSVRSQEGTTENASSIVKTAVEKSKSKSFTERKASAKECHHEIVDDGTKKFATIASDGGSRVPKDDKTVKKPETSIGTSETLRTDKNSVTRQKANDEVVTPNKDAVSKQSMQDCKKEGASSGQGEISDTDVSAKSKQGFDAAEGRSESCPTVTSKAYDVGKIVSKSGSVSKGDVCKLAIENSLHEKDTLSKSRSQTSTAENSKTSGNLVVALEKNAGETKAPNKNAGDDFRLKIPEICDEVTYPISLLATDIVNPTNAVIVNNNKSSTHEDLVHPTQEESVKCRRYSKENRPCSYPTTERREFPGLQQGSRSQQSLDYYSRDCTLSAVDYAKSRFQNVQQQTPRCDEMVKPKPKNTQIINEFKLLWEKCEQKDAGLSIPHPATRKLHMRQKISSLTSDGQRDADFPIRPFLTKGSVAERVLLFECCPERALDRSSGKSKSLLYNTWKSAGLQHKTRFWEIIGEKDRPPRSFYNQKDRDSELSKAAAYCRFSKSSNILDIPLFHYPKGRPLSQTEIEEQLKEIKTAFSAFADEKVTKEEFGIITKACGLPLYWKLPLFLSAAGENKPFLKCDVFLQCWKRIISVFHDEASQFVAALTKCSRDYLLPDDFIPMIQDIIETHPGLTFLKEATEFHSRYVHTVISRIYYCVNKSWSGKLTVAELRKSNFLQIVSLLEKEDDINQITDYFSYEHFYVIYCKFWELDKDHDLFIDKSDLSRHNDGAISSRMIDRIFSGAVTRSPAQKDGKMSYADFVWFLFSEEDKRHPRSIEYWFRCMDLDGDGYLSMYEMEYFYEEQLQRMETLNIETLPFKDCLCQMLDMIRPKIPGVISLADLKKCKMTPLFYDTFFNLEKYLDHEQRDPFASQREQDNDTSNMSDWDRYAAEEYELLVAEEGGGEHSDDLIYDDYTEEEEELLPGSQKVNGSSVISHRNTSVDVTDNDYADTDLTYY